VERCPDDGAALRPPAYGAALDGVTWGMRRCPACGRGVLDPRPVPGALGAWYGPAYFGAGERKFVGWIERFIDWFRERRARDAAAWVRRTPPRESAGDSRAGAGVAAAPVRVLDIGCGSGLFLAALARRGFECHGTEYSADAARRAAAIPGLAVHVGELADDTYAPGAFDLVSVWHVLEHLYDPDALLRRSALWLREGGVLLLAVPSIDSWQARLFRGAWFHLDPPRHLHHFGPSSLRRALHDAGFRVVRVRQLSWEQNLYGVLQSALNALGFARDDFYEALKGNRRLGASARDYVEAALLAAMILPAVAFTVAEAAAGRGGTLEIVARKVD
jgi:2-polyprenyl-3-methyl-5-hydroxy-6-metoxy-1,4-benzoquinol methylase